MFSEEGVCGTCFGYECPAHGCRCCPNGHPEDPEFYRARRLCGACYGRNVPYEDEAQPAGLTPEMLSEGDRINLRSLLRGHQAFWDGLVEGRDKKAIEWANRLLDSSTRGTA